jgi:hypothetical protein
MERSYWKNIGIKGEIIMIDAIKIFEEAKVNGMKYLEKCTPNPMGVTNGIQNWVVDDGICGFAYVIVLFKKNGAKFINQLKKKDLASSDINSFKPWLKSILGPGFKYWIREGNQSYEKKMAYAEGMVEVLQKYDIPCYCSGNLD